MKLLLRVVLVLAGLVVGASALVVFVVLLAFSAARAGWAKLTGRPVMPFVGRSPFGGFETMMRRTSASRTPRADSVAQRGRPRPAEVTDVEARPPSA